MLTFFFLNKTTFTKTSRYNSSATFLMRIQQLNISASVAINAWEY